MQRIVKGVIYIYIVLSSDIVLKRENILGMFDLDKTTTSRHTRKFIYNQEKVITVGNDLPVSYIIYYDDQKKETIVYLFSLSTDNLLKKITKGVIDNER